MVALILLTGGCGGPVVTRPTPVMEITRPELRTVPREYRIGPGDEVDIRFLYTPELNQQTFVRPDGTITLPLIGIFGIAGKSSSEAMAALRTAFSAHLKRPETVVNVKTFASQKIYVGGEVTQPGAKYMPGPMTALQAIFDAGGFRETARMDEIVIIRRGDQGQRQVFSIDLGRAISGEDLDQDILLQSMDLVFVPRSDVADVNMWVDLYIKRNLPVAVGFSYGLSQPVGAQTNSGN